MKIKQEKNLSKKKRRRTFGKRVLFLFWACLLLIACATQVAPSGGPEDKLPPRVAAIYPSPLSTNLPEELLVRIQFDEWIAQTLPRNAITISPPLDGRLRFSISGKNLEITSRALLDSNTTYTLTIGSGLKDLHGNSIAEPFLLSFSTGQKIDSLKVGGKVMLTADMISKKEFPSVALYPIGETRLHRQYLKKFRDSSDVDTLPNILREIPLYITQTDSNGSFQLIGLSPGRYRLLAFFDENGNRKLETESELAGFHGDIEIDSLFKEALWLPLASQDTSSIALDSAVQIGKSLLRAVFSRAVIVDSCAGCKLVSTRDTIYPQTLFEEARSRAPVFEFPFPKVDSSYVFYCESVKDSFGFALDSSRRSFELVWQKAVADTLLPEVAEVIPRDGSRNVFPNEKVILRFNKPILGDSLAEELRFVLQKDTVPAHAERLSPNAFEVSAASEWTPDSRVSLLKSYLDTTLALPDSLGRRDTVIEVKYQKITAFEVVSKLRMASLRGKIPGGDSQTKVRLKFSESGAVRDTLCDSEGAFFLENLLDGKYILDYFIADEEGKLDAGNVFTLRPAKPWRMAPDTLLLSPGENELKSEALPPLPKRL